MVIDALEAQCKGLVALVGEIDASEFRRPMLSNERYVLGSQAERFPLQR